MNKILSAFPKPLLEDIYEGRCVPFIGAGFSRNAVLPGGEVLPNWRQLADDICSSLPPELQGEEPLQVISYYEHEHRRPNLVRELKRALHIGHARPGAAHLAFARLPFDLIVTTNYDFLLEAAYNAVGARTCHVTIDETQLSISIERPAVNVIKMHGDLDHAARLVASELDYDEFLENNPILATFIANILITKTALFIGYSLDDYNFRHIFQIIKARLGRLSRPAYALQIDPTHPTIRRFERRGISVIPINVGKQSANACLTDVFSALRDGWNEKVASQNVAIGPFQELANPPTVSARLCLLVAPRELMPLYRTKLIPEIVDNGFDPVVSSDLQSDDTNQTAIIGTLFERADVIIADTTSAQAVAELRLGLTQRLKDYVQILVLAEDSLAPEIVNALRSARREARLIQVDLHNDVDLLPVVEWLEEVRNRLQDRYRSEPHRLFEIGEYTAAFIAALRTLESIIRECCAQPGRRFNNTPSIVRLLHTAVEHNLITSGYREQLGQLLRKRSGVLHEGTTVRRSDAIKAIELLDRFYERFPMPGAVSAPDDT